MAGTWLEARSESFFFGQNFRIFARKSVFCYRTPDFVNGPFLALGDSFDLAPSDPFLNFSFPSYGRFREGDPPTQQKVLPHLTVGALTDSNRHLWIDFEGPFGRWAGRFPATGPDFGPKIRFLL